MFDPVIASTTVKQCTGGCSFQLYQLTVSNPTARTFYGHTDTWDLGSVASLGVTYTPTKFSRSVSVDQVGAGTEELLVTVRVWWRTHFGNTQQIVVYERIFNANPL